MTQPTDVRFVIVPQWIVLHDDVTGTALRVYCVLAQYADGDGTAWPMRKTIAEQAHCSRDTVDRALDTLAAIGAVTVANRRADDGSLKSNLYTVHRVPRGYADERTDAAGGYRTGAVTPYRTDAATLTAQTRHITRPNELDPIKTLDRTEVRPTFTAFWNAYPRKAGKRKARDAWDKHVWHRRGVDPAAVIAAAAAYRDDPNREPRFTAHPTTWLNRGGWEDEPLPSNPGGGLSLFANVATGGDS